MSHTSLSDLRDEIAVLCRQISLSEVSLLDTIDADPATRSAAQAYVYVVKALEVVPGIGKVRARAMMREIGIDERCNIGSLTDVQRRLLHEALQS
jgi:hypothetical protein